MITIDEGRVVNGEQNGKELVETQNVDDENRLIKNRG